MTRTLSLTAIALAALGCGPAVSAAPGALKHPDWHPSGDLLIAEGSCAGSIDLYLIDLGAAEVRLLWAGPHTDGYPRWFADGARIAFHQIDADRNARIFVAELSADLRVTAIRRISDGPFDIEPAPAPDGRRIAYSRAGENGQDIALRQLSESSQEVHWSTGIAENFPSWDGSGTALIFHAAGPAGTQIWRRDLGSDILAPLTAGNGPNLAAHLGPRGRFLAFASERDGDREIYLRDLSSGADQRLTRRPGRDGYPKIAGDGKRIAWHSQLDDGRTVVRVHDRGSGGTVEYSCPEPLSPYTPPTN